MIRSYSSYLSIFLICLSFSIARNSEAQINAKMFDQQLPILLDSALIPGISLALIEGDRIAYSETFGYKDITTHEEVDKNTIFEAASLTKPVVAYCAMKMVEDGKLDLDKPLYQYLEYPPVANDERYKMITTRLVLSHATGFPNWRKDRSSDQMKMKFEPGSKFGYSGEGFVYLQKVMEKLEGKDLSTIVEEWVFRPLQMKHSSLVFPDTKNYATGHNSKNEPNQKYKPSSPNAAYSLHTTSEDYAKFLVELMQPHLIRKESISQMTSQQILMNSEDPSLGWGLGLGINTTATDRYFWHWGDNGVFRAFFIFSPKQEKGFVYFTNSENGLSIVNRMIKMVFEDPAIMQNWQEYKQF